MSSAVLTQVKGRGLAFQVRIQSWMSFSNAWTEVCTPRRMSLSVSRPNQRSTWLNPAGSGRGEVDMEPGVTGQPGLDLGSLVGAVIVGDQVNVQLGRHGLVDGDQEL